MKKVDRIKQIILDQLRKSPIIEAACQKAEISRMTFYRWKSEDVEFRKAADQALTEGEALVNDISESQLLTAIKNGNLTAIIFWLKNKHSDYKQKVFQSALTIAQDEDNNLYVELFGKLKPDTEKLLEPDTSNEHEQP